MARGQKLVDDREWVEVKVINTYALLMGFMSMAIRGLGFLVLTWSTVVLLGGFVSMLQKEDFWCLTFITLVQTAGIFDVFMNEKLSYIGKSVWGSVGRPLFAVVHNGGFVISAAKTLFIAAIVVAALLELAFILIPLALVYVFGLLISTVIAMWRIRKQDYGNTDGEANLKTALYILYHLAVLQGLLFCSWFMFSLRWTMKVKMRQVAITCNLKNQDLEYIWGYLEETRIGCEKDPSFTRGRNLITYAVDLMESKSPDDYFSGVRICDLIGGEREQRVVLMRHLILSAPSGHVLHKLLKTLDSSSSYGREDMRKHAARIVLHLARDIRLEQFPLAIQHISSLIATRDSDDDSDRGEDYYKKLLLLGLSILYGLAADERNCKVISDTQGLLPKIMAPVASDLLHGIQGHDEWSRIVVGSMEVMRQLVSAPGKTGVKLRREISRNEEAIRAMKRIVQCNDCDILWQIKAMKILAQLPMDTERREDFIKMLVDIFTDNKKDGFIVRESAGETLAMLSFQEGGNATIILQVHGDVIASLTEILVGELVDREKYSTIAAQILEHLCINCSKDDENLEKLQEAMTNVMPKVLNEILPGEATQTGTGADHRPGFSSPHADVEDQRDGVSQDNGRNTISSPPQESYADRNRRRLQAALLSLCITVCDTFVGADQDLARLFDALSFPRRLKEMVVRNRARTVDALRVMKVTTKMVISMMKHRGCYLKQDLESLMEAVSSVPKIMWDFDSSMVFTDDYDGPTTTKPVRTLASLVKESKELVGNYREQKLESMAPSTSASGEPCR